MVVELISKSWQSPDAPIKWIVGGLLMVTVLVSFIIIITKSYVKRIKNELEQKSKLELAYQNELLKNSIRIQEKERTRIASDLHDDLIAQLYQVQLLNKTSDLNGMIVSTIQKARKISHDLSPPMLDEHTLSEILQTFITPFKNKFEIDFHSIEESGEIIHSEVKLHVYRIFQEVLVNALKHSHAEVIQISLRHSVKHLSLVIRDQGLGFSKSKGEGLGMKNIELRANRLEGRYKFKRTFPKGTSFIFICRNHG